MPAIWPTWRGVPVGSDRQAPEHSCCLRLRALVGQWVRAACRVDCWLEALPSLGVLYIAIIALCQSSSAAPATCVLPSRRRKPRRREPDVRTFRFRALVSLNPGVPDIPAGHYPSGARMVLAEACLPDRPGRCRDFRAALCRDDGLPLRPGDHAVVTITLSGDEASAYFCPGQQFILWSGADIGHGVISRRIFVHSGPC